MTTIATPWDVLLKAPPMRLAAAFDGLPDRPAGLTPTKLDLLRDILRDYPSLPTLALAVRADLSTRQVWGLLKAPRDAGEVVFKNGRWSLVPDSRSRRCSCAVVASRCPPAPVAWWARRCRGRSTRRCSSWSTSGPPMG